MTTIPVTVAETTVFARQASTIWCEDERMALVDFIARNPESGDVIPGTGGVRKLRWSRPTTGKRGGARVIHYYHSPEAPLYLLLAYAKARAADLTSDQKKAVSALAAALKRHISAERAKR